MRGPKRREGGGLHVGRAWGELLHMKSAFGMGREGFSNLGRIRWLTMGVAMKISNICRHHMCTSSNNPIRQTDGKADGDRPPAERNGDPPPGGPFNPFCSGRGLGKAREREGGEASQLHKAPPSKAPQLALPYLLLQCRPPSSSSRQRQNLRSESRFDFMEGFYCCAAAQEPEREREIRRTWVPRRVCR